MKLLREPLFHFVVLGLALFALVGLASKPATEDAHEIVLTRGAIEDLSAGFTRLHRRPPSPEELEGAIRERIREEVYYREALALGLDRDDPLIRQRLREKMEFVSDQVGGMAEPSEEDLRRYLAEHPEAFRIEPRFTFAQVYLDPARRAERLANDVSQLLTRLNQDAGGIDASRLGDPFVLGRDLEDVRSSEVAALFGDRFAKQLGALPPGRWQGPIESAYGVHLVRIRERSEGRDPPLDEVRVAVRDDWSRRQRKIASDLFYSNLLGRYSVRVERPEPEPAP